MMTVMVTGGAGYVGSILVRDLLQEGCRVVCVDKLRFGGQSLLGIWGDPNFLLRKVDITDRAAVDAILEEVPVAAVVHLAAIVGDPACSREPEEARRVNLDASLHLIEAARRSGVERFVFASTCSNYGKMADDLAYVDEDSALAPVSLYAELKVEVERTIMERAERSGAFVPTVLRFATVYGVSPRMRFDLTVNEFAKDFALGRELTVFGEQFWRPYCHARDFSRAIRAVLGAPKERVARQVFNVGDTGENYTKKMIVEELLKQIPGGRVRYVSRKEDPRDYRVRFEKIRNVLGFRISRSIPDGIREIRECLESGIIENPDDQRYFNTPLTGP
jgi:nucleoside-diphosphate-sugar epimerase